MTKPLDAVELTKQIVRMNTINPPGDEEACAQHLGALLENAGCSLSPTTNSPKIAPVW